jgi:hypothetical protein
MSPDMNRDEVSGEGRATIEALDAYLEGAIRDGRPIEALIATRWLGQILNDRAKQAARAATEGSWSWTDVGRALGVSKQAAHEKLRSRVHDMIGRELSKLEGTERAGHAKIARRAQRGREGLDQHASPSPKIDSARQRLDEWERHRHERLTRELQKARERLAQTEQVVQGKLDKKA